MGTEILKYIKTIKKMASLPPDEIKDWQNKRLKALIKHAYQNTVYYKEIFDQHGINPSEIKDDRDLIKIPVLTKPDILNAPEKFIPKNIADIKYKHNATGGSAGDPLQYLFDNRSYNFVTAMRYYHMHRAGYRLGDKLLTLGSGNVVPDQKFSLKYKLFYFLNRRYTAYTVNLSDTITDQILSLMVKKKIKFIYGYASAIYLLACRAEQTNIAVPALTACMTTAEMLHREYREKIKSVFECKVIDFYGAGDGGIFAGESEQGKYLCGYNTLFEIENNVNPDNTGELLATDLLNYAMPFIRYRIKDRITLLKPETAKNYYNGQVISKVWGRSSEFITLENGHILTVSPFTHLFREINIKAFRIKKIDKLKILCEMQKNDNYAESEEKVIINAFNKHAGEDCTLIIKYVDNFKTLPSGKRDYFITEAKNNNQ